MIFVLARGLWTCVFGEGVVEGGCRLEMRKRSGDVGEGGRGPGVGLPRKIHLVGKHG